MPADRDRSTGPGAWSRRRFLTAGATVSAGLALGACSLSRASTTDDEGLSDSESDFPGGLVDPPFPKPAVTFTDVDGKPFDFVAETKDKLALLFFGYTNCPDICPVTLNVLASARDAMSGGPGSEPMVCFVGVDTARDTPAALKTYLGNIDSTFIGLTASDEVIAQAINVVKGAPVQLEVPDADGNYIVGHPAQVTAYSPDNVAHRIFSGVAPSGMRQEDWVKVLPKLARNEYT